MFSFELPKRSTEPIEGAKVHPISHDIPSAQTQLQARGKLALTFS